MTTFTQSADGAALINALLATDSGITVLGTPTLSASGPAAAQLYDGTLQTLGIGAGVLLTSGIAPGTSNTVGWFGQDNGGDGNANIDAVVNTVFNTVSYDATTLAFDFTVAPGATSISFDIVFGSDEYPEWVDQFVDCAVVMVNGVNYALFEHDPLSPLSVISSNLAAGYFQDNSGGAFQIEYDGVSRVLKIVAPINPGETNHIEICIADTGDHIYDSGIFIANLKAGTTPGSGVVTNPGGCTEGDDQVVGSTQGEFYDLASGNDIAYAGGGDDIVIGAAGNDKIYGGSGNDDLEGDAGDDLLDGGTGDDTAVYAGKVADYTLSYDGVTTTISSAADGVDTLTGIEKVKFADGLYTLNGATLTLVDPGTPPSGNSPGIASIVGIGAVGSTLTAVVSDPDGIPGAVSWTWYADGSPIVDEMGNSYVVAANYAGAEITVKASYSDGLGQAELVLSATKGIASQNDGDFTIDLIVLDAPAGATTQNPLTTLLARLVEAGTTPAEGAAMLHAVFGIADTVDLRTYDAWAALNVNSADLTVRAVEGLCLQVAVLTSASGDQSGIALAQAVAAAFAASQTIDLADPDFIATLIDPVIEPDPITQILGPTNPAYLEVVDRNKNLSETVSKADPITFLQKQWSDFQSGLDIVLSDTVADLSLHINQAPTGNASGEFATDFGQALTLTQADLITGFTDAEGDPLTATDLQVDQGGTLVDDGSGGWEFTPDEGFSGPVELSWLVDDGQGGVTVASAMLIVQAPPTPIDHPAAGTLAVTGAAEEGGTLVASLTGVVDADGTTTTDYRWQQYTSTEATPFWVDIAGATTDTLTIAADQSDVGKIVRVVATTTDALGGTTELPGADYTIVNVDDKADGTLAVSGTAEQGGSLTASLTDVVDADGATTTAYQWQENTGTEATPLWVDIVGATTDTLSIASDHSDVGKIIRVVATTTDALGGTTEFIGSATTIAQAAGQTLTGTSAADTLTGGAGGDTLTGLGGNDKLYGMGGDDLLDGGAGTDLMDGGEGSDVYLIALAADHKAAEVKDSGESGIDELRFSWTGKAATLKLYASDTGLERIVIGTGTGATADTSGIVANNINAGALGYGVTLVGNAGNNTLTGGAAADQLEGGAGTDKLLGGNGNDTLLGGDGRDTLTGGAGADRFVFDTVPNATTNLDTITDFAHLVDKLVLDATVFEAIGPTFDATEFYAASGATAGQDADDRIVYNTKTGALYYDADGNGAGAAVQIALIGTSRTHPTLSWDDFELSLFGS